MQPEARTYGPHEMQTDRRRCYVVRITKLFLDAGSTRSMPSCKASDENLRQFLQRLNICQFDTPVLSSRYENLEQGDRSNGRKSKAIRAVSGNCEGYQRTSHFCCGLILGEFYEQLNTRKIGPNAETTIQRLARDFKNCFVGHKFRRSTPCVKATFR
jgi:hypothetical protein